MTTALSPARPATSNTLPAPLLGSATSNPYAVINASLKHLREETANVESAWAACRAYVSLGLYGPARELLSTSGPLASAPECRELHRQIAHKPSGRLAWGSLRPRFEKNAATLFQAKPQLRRHDEEFRRLPYTGELYKTNDGTILLSTLTSDGRRWLPNVTGTAAFAQSLRLAHSPTDQFCGNYVLAGDRCFAVLRRLFDATSKMFMSFSPRIFVVEPDVSLFAAGLFACESIEPLLHERTMLFLGSECLADLAAFLGKHPEINPPAYQVCCPIGRDEFERQFSESLQAIHRQRNEQTAKLIGINEARCANMTRDTWRERIEAGSHEPLNVLGITSRFTTVLQYSMRDLKSAFERRGHRFHMLIEPTDHDLLDASAFARAVAEARPDLIFVIDHHRAEYAGILPTNVPYVCWMQDALPNLTSRAAGSALGPLDFYITATIGEYARAYNYPRERGMIWTIATDTNLYSRKRLDDDELAPHQCDFSYVSNQSTPPELFHERCRKNVQSQNERRILDTIYELLRDEFRSESRDAGTRQAMQVLEDAVAVTGINVSSENQDLISRNYIHPLAELMFRQTTLNWVADYCEQRGRRLRLYGQDWGLHPRFAAFAAGTAANGRQLRAIYQATTINLQINGYSAVHPRLLDGLAAGGFFLIRYTPFDVIEKPIRRLLDAMRQYSLQPDKDYDSNTVPKFANALDDVVALRGGKPGSRTRITAADFELYTELEAALFRRTAVAVWPEYGQVSFGTFEEFCAHADHYLAHSAERMTIAARMGSTVTSLFTYDALLDRMFEFLHATV